MIRLIEHITSLFTLLGLVLLVFGRDDEDISKSRPTASVNSDKTKDNDSYEEFKPTNEWQTVKKGQPIPRGLHVRMNLETGQTEAKLLDSEENKDVPTAVSTVKGEEVNEINKDTAGSTDNILAREYLQEALQKMNDDEELLLQDGENDILKKFRTYEELKKDLKSVNMLVKTEIEVLTNLMKNFTTSSDEAKITILTDLELLVHQFDNAREFARMDGFINIVYPSFNSTNAHLRAESIKLLGSAAQSNPKVQISALSSGGIQLLLRALLLDKDLTVRSHALYALSCLIRNFPLAQNKMITEGGLAVLSQVFDRKENNKLQVKVVTLLHDLAEERTSTKQSIQESENPTEEMKHKLNQYRAINFEGKLLEAEWCQRIPTLLPSESSTLDDDCVEKVVSAMFALVKVCKDQFKHKTVRTILLSLESSYKDLITREPDQYYTDLIVLIQNLTAKLKLVNDEL